jgi:hypothetical protein
MLLTVMAVPTLRHEFCPQRFCRFMEYYRASKNTNAPLTFGERIVYSLSQADAAQRPQASASGSRYAF